jgi:hypothetical protein
LKGPGLAVNQHVQAFVNGFFNILLNLLPDNFFLIFYRSCPLKALKTTARPVFYYAAKAFGLISPAGSFF